MSNPALNKAFGTKVPTTPAGYPAYPGYVPGEGAGRGGQQQYGYAQNQYVRPQQQQQELENAWRQPAASPVDTQRMTLDDVILRTAMTLGVLLLAAVPAWMVSAADPSLAMVLWIGGLLGGLVLGLVNSFKREPSPALILAYAAFEGLFLGAISSFFEYLYPGIVIQAVLATVVTFAVTLGLYTTRIVRVTAKFTRFVIIAMASYLAFSVVNLVLMLTGVSQGMFGLRSAEIFGIPAGLLIGAFAVVLATMSLLMDFNQIEQGVKAGVPERYSWSAAFGLTVTLVWLYLELLRIIAILRGDQ